MKTEIVLTLIMILIAFCCCVNIEKEKISDEESRKIAEEFILSSPTYSFDGYDLEYQETWNLETMGFEVPPGIMYNPNPSITRNYDIGNAYLDFIGRENCYLFAYVYTSRHAGYGNRTGMVLAQVITPHTAVVIVDDGEVVSAILDNRWDMIEQKDITPIGGDKDEHGCLGAAGYSWCAGEDKCMRKWEGDCKGDEEIESFQACVAAGYPIRESYPRQCQVSGTNKSFTESIGLANPAATYCENQGHEYRTVTDESGQSGECYVEGEWVDAWRYYRSETEEFEFEVVENTSEDCVHDYDCETPFDYQVRSDCPYTSKCIDNVCAVVCPTPETGEERAVRLANEYVVDLSDYREYNGRNIKVNEILQARCIGCWTIDLEFYADSAKAENKTDKVTVQVTLAGWEVVDSVVARGVVPTLSPEECLALGGRNVNIVGGATCYETETYAGDVVGFISPNICCVPGEEAFCGSSTHGKCSSASDCVTGGCSAQICQSVKEGTIMSTCEYRECYDAGRYGLTCGCVSGECVWS